MPNYICNNYALSIQNNVFPMIISVLGIPRSGGDDATCCVRPQLITGWGEQIYIFYTINLRGTWVCLATPVQKSAHPNNFHFCILILSSKWKTNNSILVLSILKESIKYTCYDKVLHYFFIYSIDSKMNCTNFTLNITNIFELHKTCSCYHWAPTNQPTKHNRHFIFLSYLWLCYLFMVWFKKWFMPLLKK